MKQLPFMAHMRRDRHPRQTVGDVMSPAVVSLPARASLAEVRAVLRRHPTFDSVPVVADADGGLLLGAVRRRSLIAALAAAADASDAGPAVPLRVEEDSEGEGDGSGSGSERSAGGKGGAPGAGALGRAPPARRPRTAAESFELVDMHAEADGAAAGERPRASAVGDGAVNGAAPAAGPADAAAPGGAAAAAAAAAPPPPRGATSNGSAHIRATAGADARPVRDDTDAPLLRLRADLSPLVVTANTTLGQLHFMFVMLMPTHALVTSRGRLAGVVRRGDLIQSGQLVVTAPAAPALPADADAGEAGRERA